MENRTLFAQTALLPEGWCQDVLFEVGPTGDFVAVTAGAEPGGAYRLAGPAIPGMPNLHSHAFQRAIAGLAEHAADPSDSFWTWREVMYGFVRSLTPDQVEAIATQLYIEMLKAGYTAVGEFHYLHHDPEGRPYAKRSEMAKRLLAAARATGIGITLLPVLYGYGGFGGQPANEGQRRFLNTPEGLLRIVEELRAETRGEGQAAVGLAPHSLRAVTPESLAEALEGLRALDPLAPVHIHVSEQIREVEDCLDWSGRRPVAWLLSEVEVDARLCLIHATHMDAAETSGLAASGAVAGLCPATEANLGDGLFPAPPYMEAGGAWGIGSDSHVSVSPVEELRWLEYGQRLVLHRRNVLRPADGGHVGGYLYRSALKGGAQALGRPLGAFAPGRRADLVVLDGQAPTLTGKTGEALLDALIFAGNANPVRDVMVGGKWQVRDGAHRAEAEASQAYRAALAALAG
jgi:formimidoylglutamate deiminase